MFLKLTRLTSALLTGLLAVASSAQAQRDIDLASVIADPIKLIFSDERTTVASYVYYTIETQSSCCGSDAIYLEVKINAEGKTDGVRALTGRNDCFKRSVADVLRDIRWDKAKVQSGKTIYFELKPVKACAGTPGENTYKPLGSAASLAAQQAAEQLAKDAAARELAMKEAAAKEAAAKEQALKEQAMKEATAIETAAKEQVAKEKAAKEKPAPAAKPIAAAESPKPAEPKPTETRPSEVAKAAPAKSEPAAEPGMVGDTKLPRATYASAGDRQPDPSHAQSHANGAGPLLAAPEYVDGDALQALYLKQQLRKAGVCGLVHVLAELTVDKAPKDATGAEQPAQVVSYRIFRANTKQVLDVIPGILAQLRYKAESVRYRQNIYLEFKADVDCGPGQPQTNLGNVRDYLKNPEKPQ